MPTLKVCFGCWRFAKRGKEIAKKEETGYHRVPATKQKKLRKKVYGENPVLNQAPKNEA